MNSKKRCTFCKEYFAADGMIKTPAGTFCCALHALEYAKTKQRKKDKKAHTADKKKFYRNDRATQTRLAQKAFNTYIRYRDRNQPCISCGTESTDITYCAGHYRTRGGAPHLRFNQFNVNLQCNMYCNLKLSGNIGEYRINLIKKFGLVKVEEIENTNNGAKLSLDDIVAIKVYYKRLLKSIKEVE